MNRTVSKIIIAVVLAAIVICSLTAFSSMAETKTKEQPATYYTDIVLERGETLSSIESRYNTGNYFTRNEYIDEVKRINGLDCDSIHEGCYLTIIYY